MKSLLRIRRLKSMFSNISVSSRLHRFFFVAQNVTGSKFVLMMFTRFLQKIYIERRRIAGIWLILAKLWKRVHLLNGEYIRDHFLIRIYAFVFEHVFIPLLYFVTTGRESAQAWMHCTPLR